MCSYLHFRDTQILSQQATDKKKIWKLVDKKIGLL